ncbi:small conductance mechanosensitive channel [Mucilaginibacter mallensis]|uniref:Small conductance mechanosensitive channel n=1 Tax=Mucilaginibacter mallensis TaxID=652787 RepID=A0A1H1NU33_MUCMA|nr:mechanosensitive ion channel domain-containing protein [Mucilaginibacter mallensis]SDS01879.1 small conductance mechanosensitive channel [Mucilaginibacter mallensis]
MKLTKLYDKAYDWLLDIGPKIIIGLIILFIGIWLIKMLRTRLRDQMLKKKVHSSLQPFFLSLTITSLYILLIIVVMNVVGLELTIFTTIIGAFSVAAGLALSGTLQNFAGGVLILLLKPFGLDDNIVAQGQDGIVTSIQIFYTVLLTFDSKTVIIPNGKLFNEVIVNVTREGKRRLDFEIKLGYVANVEQVKNVIWNAVKSTPNVLNDPRNKVGISALEIDGVKFVVNAWVNPGDFGAVKLALQEKILNDLVTAGVKLPGV